MADQRGTNWRPVWIAAGVAFLAGMILIHTPEHIDGGNAVALRVVGAATWAAIVAGVAAAIVYLRNR